jgi:orotidine-5'-phosphate decarboxylase
MRVIEEDSVTFVEKLRSASRQRDTFLCVGLDPVLERLPETCRRDKEPLYVFCKAIAEATADLALAFKINTAFFEAHGSHGWRQLEHLVSELPADVVRIADAKRGDIGHSSELYAQAFFHRLAFDAVTVNPVLGRDSVEPFLRDPRRGAFFLCLTSNPGAEDFQFFSDGRQPFHEKVLLTVRSWNRDGNVAAVVGATRPEQLRRLRALAPDLPFLIPGIGAQKGDLGAVVDAALGREGELALINASRSIIYRSSGGDFAEAARSAATKLRDRINRLVTQQEETHSNE